MPGLHTAGEPDLDVVVVGAGFGGLYALYRLRQLGFSAMAFEAGPEVGGTWFWNRYPGLRCDIESADYSYSFSEELQQDWAWSERFATHSEILAYLEHVADRFDLRRHIRFATRVTAAGFDEDLGCWRVQTDAGDQVRCSFVVMATGPLSVPIMPDVPGLDSFAGLSVHTARWPENGVDFSGKRVAVIGTGSSGVQAIPIIARQAERLLVFQRTPAFSLPARNRSLSNDDRQQIKASYPERRAQARRSFGGAYMRVKEINRRSALDVSDAERNAEYECRWQEGGLAFMSAFADLLTDMEANRTAADFIRAKIRSVVADPEVAAILCPTGLPFAAKRPCVDTGYYETFNRDNVMLVDTRSDPIRDVVETGLRTTSRSFEVDVIVYATGYDAITGALRSVDIRGRSGASLGEAWSGGPRAYLGMAAAGFPNLFFVAGPCGPAPLGNVVHCVEQNVEWISDLLKSVSGRNQPVVEPTLEAEEGWMVHLDQLAQATLWPRADSWYTGANVPGKARVFMAYAGGISTYRKRCDTVAAHGYEGFQISDVPELTLAVSE